MRHPYWLWSWTEMGMRKQIQAARYPFHSGVTTIDPAAIPATIEPPYYVTDEGGLICIDNAYVDIRLTASDLGLAG
jgi:hypothetical protein